VDRLKLPSNVNEHKAQIGLHKLNGKNESFYVVPRLSSRLIFQCVCLARDQGFITMWAMPLADEEHKGVWLE
jgi:hypothetical protein